MYGGRFLDAGARIAHVEEVRARLIRTAELVESAEIRAPDGRTGLARRGCWLARPDVLGLPLDLRDTTWIITTSDRANRADQMHLIHSGDAVEHPGGGDLA